VSAVAQAFALRAPWYVREREQQTPFDPAARRPAIQKHDTTDFVDRIVADPRDSLAFDDDDRWSFPIPVGFPGPGTGRQLLATHRLLRTPMRKLYQPSHDRFYTVAVEVFCDEAGLPRPGAVPGLEVGFVVRRERVRSLGPPSALRKLASSLIRDMVRQSGDEHLTQLRSTKVPDSEDVCDLLWGQQAVGHQFSARQQALLEQIRPRWVVEGWVVTSAGRGSWRTVRPGDEPALLDGEQEQPMWRLPPRVEDCEAATTRSLWFGVVPTYSADVDEIGLPKLDDRSVYRIRCFARLAPAPGHEHCPPRIWWSDPTPPYRLAAFFDPSGSKNRRVSVKLPDFRTLAARAAEPAGPGGVEIVQPPGSQLPIKTPGEIPELDQGGVPDGLVSSSCTFAIELLAIVAMFVFSLFLPVVLFAFQLWWMLALRFCWPRDADAVQALTTFLDKNDLSAVVGNATLRGQLDELLEVPGGAKLLADTGLFTKATGLAKAVPTTLDPAEAVLSVAPVPEPRPDDPLCPRPS
jgi:hypothetical protein